MLQEAELLAPPVFHLLVPDAGTVHPSTSKLRKLMRSQQNAPGMRPPSRGAIGGVSDLLPPLRRALARRRSSLIPIGVRRRPRTGGIQPWSGQGGASGQFGGVVPVAAIAFVNAVCIALQVAWTAGEEARIPFPTRPFTGI